jgi:hypothetical protein
MYKQRSMTFTVKGEEKRGEERRREERREMN